MLFFARQTGYNLVFSRFGMVAGAAFSLSKMKLRVYDDTEKVE